MAARAGEPPAAKPADLTPADVKKLAAGTDVHAVGVYETTFRGRVAKKEVRDWATLLKHLAATDGPAGRVADRLTARARAVLKDEEKRRTVVSEEDSWERLLLRGDIVTALSAMLDSADLYDAKAFDAARLTDEGKRLVKLDKRSPMDGRRLNRLLLNVALPDALKAAEVTADAADVRVAAGRPVTLVLTSCHSCRWRVALDDGAVVALVVVGGHEPHEVEGVTCPVVHRTTYPDTAARAKRDQTSPDALPVAHRDGDARYRDFAGKVQALTGKAPASFQGRYGYYERKPFVIGGN